MVLDAGRWTLVLVLVRGAAAARRQYRVGSQWAHTCTVENRSTSPESLSVCGTGAVGHDIWNACLCMWRGIKSC